METLTSGNCPNCDSENTKITGLITIKYTLKRYADYIGIAPNYIHHLLIDVRMKYRWNVSQIRINSGEFDRDNLEKRAGIGTRCGGCRKTIKTGASVYQGNWLCQKCIIKATSMVPNQKGHHTGKLPYKHLSRKQLAQRFRNQVIQ